MTPGVEPERVRALNGESPRDGDYVLDWMQSSHRTDENPALQCAVERADRLHLPLVAYFGLWPSYPGSSLRHARFMLEGLEGVGRSLEALGVRFVLREERPDTGVLDLAKSAAVVIVDRAYLGLQRSWYRAVAEGVRCPLYQVEGDVTVPVETASQKEEYSAATFRRRVLPHLDRFLRTAETVGPERSSLALDLPTLAGESVDALLSRLEIDRTVPVSASFTGGADEANRRFEGFLERRLDGFADDRNEPGGDGSAEISPYLHFGQVSPVALAVLALDHGGPGVEAFLEELVVRRELAVNFVHYNDAHDSFAPLPAWAQTTLARHRDDRREYVYSLNDLDRAATHDPYWNAAQEEMTTTGKMQGYMRMYWGKKILEWSPTPEEAYASALYLNNRYEIDGRDPNGYAGVAWCFGKHDRPWKERPIFGTVRYMNARGLDRKFAMDRYVEKVRQAR